MVISIILGIIIYFIGVVAAMVAFNLFNRYYYQSYSIFEINALSWGSWLSVAGALMHLVFHWIGTYTKRLQKFLNLSLGTGRVDKINEFYKEMRNYFSNNQNGNIIFRPEGKKLYVEFYVYSSDPLSKNTIARSYIISKKYEFKNEKFITYIKEQIPQEFL